MILCQRFLRYISFLSEIHVCGWSELTFCFHRYLGVAGVQLLVCTDADGHKCFWKSAPLALRADETPKKRGWTTELIELPQGSYKVRDRLKLLKISKKIENDTCSSADRRFSHYKQASGLIYDESACLLRGTFCEVCAFTNHCDAYILSYNSFRCYGYF